MSGTLVRTILALACLVSTLVICFLIFVMLESNGPYEQAMIISVLVTAVYFVIVWTWVWYGVVNWTNRRKKIMIFLALGIIVCTIVVANAIGATQNRRHTQLILGGLGGGSFFIFAWTIGTVLLWKETAEERASRMENLGVDGVSCPACGYNMTGLKNATCPECGKVYTVDQIVAHVIESKRDVLAGE